VTIVLLCFLALLLLLCETASEIKFNLRNFAGIISRRLHMQASTLPEVGLFNINEMFMLILTTFSVQEYLKWK